MTQTIQIGDIAIIVTRKDIKHVHLSVHPPLGRVSLVVPVGTRPEVSRAYAISKLRWIREQREKLKGQARETPRQFIERESHYLWGRRYLLSVVEKDAKPCVRLDHRKITLVVRPGSTASQREVIMRNWQRSLLHESVPKLVRKWETRIGVKVGGYFVQRMKTKWGSCNHRTGKIRLNTELVKKPRDLLEYVVVHEVLHLMEPTHSDRFIALLTKHYPSWREARAELNELPLRAEAWTK